MMEERDPRPASTWPTKLFVASAAVAVLQLAIFTPTLSGRDRNSAIMLTQVAIIAIVLVRLAVARLRREQGRMWIVYVGCLLLAAPIWILGFEPLIRWLGVLTR